MPTFDAVGPSASGFTSAATPYQWSHTVASDATLLLVGVSCGTDSRTLTVTAGGVAMTTNAGSNVWKRHTDDNTAGFGQWYALPAPPTGSVTIVVSGATTGDRICGGSLSFKGTALDASAYGTPVSAIGSSAAPTVNIVTTGASNLVAAFLAAGQVGGTVGGTSTSRFAATGDTNSGAGNLAGQTAPATGSSVTMSRAINSDFWAIFAVEVLAGATVLPPSNPPPQPGSQQFRRRHYRSQTAVSNPFVPPPDFAEHGSGTDSLNIPMSVALTDSGSGSDAFGLGPPVIAALGGTGAGYFVDQYGNPRLLWGDAAWGLPGNVGRWSSGAWAADYDAYFTARAGQGFTAIYTKPMGTAQSGNIDSNGGQYDGTMPFTGGAGANPSTGFNSTYWARIDYMLASAAARGLTIFLNAIGYDSDFNGGPGPLSGKTTTEFQAYGAAIGARYAGTKNLIWVVADDYFGGIDTKIDSFLTGLRGAGASQPIAIENMAESTSRKTLDPVQTATAWGAANAQYNWVYSYAPIYRGVEQAYLESSPIPVIAGDGYFYQGSTSYAGGTSFAFDRCFRQEAWWALSSGARGKIHGDEGIWQWPSTAAASSASHWWYANESANIVTAFTALTDWNLLVPDTSSALVTAGRGTRASAFTSGGGGGQYEPANTDSYVTASVTPSGSLAVIYLSHGTTITIDETQVGGTGNYTAKRMDPDSGALTSLTAGTTYNSTGFGNNGKGDPDWVIVLQKTSSTVSKSLSESGAGSDALGITSAVPLAESGAAALALTVTAPTALGESGSGSDGLLFSVPVALTEGGAAADSLVVSAAVSITLTDAGAGSDVLTVLAVTLIGLTEAGAGTDALGVASAVPLAESGTGTVALASSALLSLTEAGAGDGTLALTQPTPLSDVGAGSDALNVTLVSAVALTDAGAGSDLLTVTIAVALAETGSGADSITGTAAVALAETGASAEALTVNGSGPILFPETGTASDALTITVTVLSVALGETGTGSLTITVTAPTALTDTGSGSDALTISQGTASIALAETGAGLDSLTAVASILAVSFAESGTGTDVLAIIFSKPLAETGTGSDVLVIALALAAPLTDVAAGAVRGRWAAGENHGDGYGTVAPRGRWAAGPAHN